MRFFAVPCFFEEESVMTKPARPARVLLALVMALFMPARGNAQTGPALRLEPIPGGKQRNIVFILIDDMRYDFFGFMGHPFLKTPHLDALARGGVHCRNAFVTTSLCSPSRASILTGVYAHRHRVIDNNNPLPPGRPLFPQYLRQAGYATAFVGKWHMGGERDDPQPGFDHWISFKGQGTYLPGKNGMNVNGKRRPQKGYITDELTDYAVDWLQARPKDRPFFLYLSHKAVHVDLRPGADGQARVLVPGATAPREFIAAPRHKGRYKHHPVPHPKTMANTPENLHGRPMWVRNQRDSVIGVDYAFYTTDGIDAYYRQYCETLLAVDESVGRLVAELRRQGLLEGTLIVFMSDNGYLFGEHGLIDKRAAYEESIRVPLLLHCPELFQGGTRVERMVANIDIAPTLLAAAGLKAPAGIDGSSFLPLARGELIPWRDALLYEYFWERNLPMVPTMHALRTERYVYIRYHGLWDQDELFDLRDDPRQTKNLIESEAHRPLLQDLNRRLFQELAASDGLQLPLPPDRGLQQNQRRRGAPPAADFPPSVLRD
jgi:N-acetylglucosamine-6-sulfatase